MKELIDSFRDEKIPFSSASELRKFNLINLSLDADFPSYLPRCQKRFWNSFKIESFFREHFRANNVPQMAVISVNYVIVKSSAKIFEYSYAKHCILKFLSYYDFSWKNTKTGKRINLCSPVTFRRWKIFAESLEISQFKIILRFHLKLRSYLKSRQCGG